MIPKRQKPQCQTENAEHNAGTRRGERNECQCAEYDQKDDD